MLINQIRARAARGGWLLPGAPGAAVLPGLFCLLLPLPEKSSCPETGQQPPRELPPARAPFVPLSGRFRLLSPTGCLCQGGRTDV